MKVSLTRLVAMASARKRLAAALLALFAASPAWAALGQPEDSVAADQLQLRGEIRSFAAQGFVVHEISSPGLVVREYVAPSGLVFGVSWRGTAMPDLGQLLGPHFA